MKLTLYRLDWEFYRSNNFADDTESPSRIKKLGHKVLTDTLPNLNNHCRGSGYQFVAMPGELFGGYWKDSAENIYRVI